MPLATLEIKKELIPYSFKFTKDGLAYDFAIRYNAEHDFFTMDLGINEEWVILGEKINYGRPLFANFEHFPTPKHIIPLDPASSVSRVGYRELQNTVKLFILEQADETV